MYFKLDVGVFEMACECSLLCCILVGCDSLLQAVRLVFGVLAFQALLGFCCSIAPHCRKKLFLQILFLCLDREEAPLLEN